MCENALKKQKATKNKKTVSSNLTVFLVSDIKVLCSQSTKLGC